MTSIKQLCFMNRKIFSGLYILIFLLSVTGCQENEQMIFSEKPSAYFSSITASDSISYSFASGKVKQDTVLVPIKIIGESTDYDREIAFSIDASSTAKAGVQYKALDNKVILPAGKVETQIKVVVFDKELDKSDVSLIFALVPNDNFNLGYGDRLTAKVIITNQLVKPTYWDIPLSFYYGEYSKAKHRLCIQLQGEDFPPTWDRTKVQTYMSYGRMVYNYLLKTPVWDEDTQTWITADWSPL